MTSELTQAGFWFSVLQVIWINILLSGDNAVVIALACRGLPPRERLWGMIIGAGLASVLLIVFTGVISVLMTLPYLQIVGAIVLMGIAIKLLAPQRHDQEDTPEATEDLWRAVRLVVVADIVMSLDNVIAVAGIARGRYLLLGLGLAVSIPLVIAGSAIILWLIERFPILVWAGAGLLGWVAGDILVGDPIIHRALSEFDAQTVELVAQGAGALLVIAIGFLWRRQHDVALTQG